MLGASLGSGGQNGGLFFRSAWSRGSSRSSPRAKPTLEYDPLYGQANGATDRFVESVYKSLRAKK